MCYKKRTYDVLSTEFFQKVDLANFSSNQKRSKLKAFKANLKKAHNNEEVPNDETFDFLKHFHLLGYDLDIKAGVTLALLHSMIGQFSQKDVPSIWARVIEEVSSANQNAGTISAESIPEDLFSVFKKPHIETIPKNFVIPRTPKPPKAWGGNAEVTALTTAMLLGKWNDCREPDIEIIKRLIDGL